MFSSQRSRHESTLGRMTEVVLVASICFCVSPLEAKPFDHSAWGEILKEYVNEAGWVDYHGIQKEAAGKLRAYLDRLARADVDRLDHDERIAFWINAYNSLCVQKILDHGIPASVPKAVLFGANIFTQRTHKIAGKVRSLDDIEHKILRKKFEEPRIHAALVCAASSCPRLRPEPYTGKELDDQLDEECQRWIQGGKDRKGRQKNYLDRNEKTFYASKIFDWFEEDFGGEAGALEFITKYVGESDRTFMKKHDIRLRYLAYDWSLNLQSDPSRSGRR